MTNHGTLESYQLYIYFSDFHKNSRWQKQH